jgi:hypothetical protein
LLGFAAIVSVFRARDSKTWTPDGRFWGMVSSASATFVFSLFPLPFLAAKIDPPYIWMICSIAFCSVAACLCMISVRAYLRDRASAPGVNRPLFAFILGGSTLSAIILGLNAGGFFLEQVFWPYLTALVWFQIITGIAFLRLMIVWMSNR